MKRIILAIDSFKGCLSSLEAEEAAEHGLNEGWQGIEVVKVPVTDGGDGMLEVFLHLSDCERVFVECHDALMRPIRASYGVRSDNTIIIETALSCGINLINNQELNPLRATTYGVGELLADALQKGYKKFIIGLGGSATSDCGLGMLTALKNILGNSWRDKILHNLDVTLASDVSNPLYGEHGAAAVFGPQKGATTEMVGYLDRRARTFSRMASVQLGVDHAFDKGAGAAGGLGYAFLQFMNAKIQSGVDILFETINFDAIIDKADLIITGEGSADAQTLMGKLPVKVLEYGLPKNIPVVLIAGRVVDVSSLLSAGFSQVECVTPSDIPFSEAIKPVIAKENIHKTMFKL